MVKSIFNFLIFSSTLLNEGLNSNEYSVFKLYHVLTVKNVMKKK